MAKSPSVNSRIINLSGPTSIPPTGVPAGVVGTSKKGKAFVPTTVATTQDFVINFGEPTNDAFQAPMAISEWLRSASSATFIRILGVGNGLQRTTDGANAGKVTNGGFVVGSQLPQENLAGNLGRNTKAVFGGQLGRTYFLGCFMSQSTNSTIFSEAGLRSSGLPVVRAVLFAASGTLLTLSTSTGAASNTPNPAQQANWTNAAGAVTGSVNLNSGRQEFVMLINGQTNTDSTYPNVITASFDITAPNYITNVFNKDSLKIENAGYYLYADWPIHTAMAVVTGANAITSHSLGFEKCAFLVTGSQARDAGSATAPNYEGFEDRYRSAKSSWVTSQKFGGKYQNLFRVHALSDGVGNNYKISIENITPSISDTYKYGTFDLLVRDISDNDKNKIVFESFRGLTLDPDSPKYIAKVIGDYNTFYNLDTAIQGNAKLVTEGNYPNNSRYIRVEVATTVEDKAVDETALPMGFRGLPHLVTSGSGPIGAFSDVFGEGLVNPWYNLVQPPIPFRQNVSRGPTPNKTADKGLYWGVQFERKISATEPNLSTTPESGINSFVSYFPDYHTSYANVVVSANEGTADTTTLGIMDADRFNNNVFSLENVLIYYNSSTLLPNTSLITSWSYVRTGSISTDTSGLTRALAVSDLTDSSTRQVAKFSFYLQGGFDGLNIFNTETKNLTDLAITQEVNNISRGGGNGPTAMAYKTALDLIEDTSELDVQLFAIPGIRNSVITDRALQIAENRFDALYLMDIANYDTSNALVTSSNQVPSVRYTTTNFRNRGLNSSFGAAYFPDVVMRDTINNTTRNVAPSVAALGAFATNDAVAFPWYAPAGFTRGSLRNVNQTTVDLSQTNMDDLYEANINSIASFPGSGGPVIWGQKTLYAQQSALDRINVRRLLLSLRREVKKISNRILFEQGLPETLARFSQLVNPILKKVQDQKGVDKYRVVIDASVTSDADFENKTIRGKIFIIPTRSLEFLSLDFTINNSNNFGQG